MSARRNPFDCDDDLPGQLTIFDVLTDYEANGERKWADDRQKARALTSV